MIANINFGLNPVLTKENLFGDNIAKIEAYDFSTANLSDEHRLHAITSIASICYNNPKAINSQSLYDRLYRESKGLPSSSFEFIKMLIPVNIIIEKIIDENNKNLLEYGNVNRCLKDHEYSMLNIFKFGTVLIVDGIEWVLTNYRAVVHDQSKFNIDLTDFYNNEYQCNIIKHFSYVFKIRMDTNTRTQFIRHRVAGYQELCISGDSIIKTSQGPRTIKELYDIQERQKLRSKNNVKYCSVRTYDFDKEILISVPIKEVFKTGKKEVLEVTIQYGTTGKTHVLKSTKEHKFLTKNGWVCLEDLKIKDYVAINGVSIYRDKSWLLKTKEKFLKKGMAMKGIAATLNINYNTLKKWMHIHKVVYTPKEVASTYDVWNKGIVGEDSHSYGRIHSDVIRQKISDIHTKELGTTRQGYSKRMRSYWEADFRRKKVLEKYNNKCALCKSDKQLELDHIKPVYSHPELGFDEDNMQILCKKCHSNKTAIETHTYKKTIHYGMITSIKSVGEEETYDMEIDHVDHNYVANNIIVHNSRRYVSGKRLAISFYEKENCNDIYSKYVLDDKRTGHSQALEFTTTQVHEIALNHYFTLLDNKVLPQDARRVLPQSMYTDLWVAFDYESFHNFKELRSNEHAQWEIRVISETMEEFVSKIKNSIKFKMKKADNFVIDNYKIKGIE